MFIRSAYAIYNVGLGVGLFLYLLSPRSRLEIDFTKHVRCHYISRVLKISDLFFYKKLYATGQTKMSIVICMFGY